MPPLPRLRFAHVVGIFSTLVPLSFAGFSAAAPPYVDRSITMPRHDWAFDVGLGIGIDARTPSRTGPGFNLEMGVGITEHVELGFRTGLRLGDDARFTGADSYGRLYDRETFGTGTGSLANPEVRVRGALMRGGPVELALEGRATLPAPDSRWIGFEVGLPLAFHAGHSVRIDTGAYVPVVFYDPTLVGFHVPLNVWFQVTPKVFLGPITGLRFTHQADFDRTDFSLGFGLGVALSRTIDLKTMFLVPRVNDRDGARDFGLGVGLQFRIE